MFSKHVYQGHCFINAYDCAVHGQMHFRKLQANLVYIQRGEAIGVPKELEQYLKGGIEYGFPMFSHRGVS